ncbi:hypothetical protein Plim_2223 [Planctopirus limnophila DSM 3776]|uniref:Uncharacterized protein n=2 Tax=Planctopirus limnophila TaxID=120 RepID=D5SMZ4_PLAL2|nr:hypothetical protein Plim_2223 [Planctopirus limnophila DSM 3776]
MQVFLAALSTVISVSVFAISADRFPVIASLLAGICLLIWLVLTITRRVDSEVAYQSWMLVAAGGFNAACWLSFAISSGSPFFAGVLAGLILIAFLGQSLASSVYYANMNLVKDQLDKSAPASSEVVTQGLLPAFDKQLAQAAYEAHPPADAHPYEIERSLVGSLWPDSAEDDLPKNDDETTTPDDSVSHVVRFVYDDREVQEGHLRIEFEQGARESLFHLVFSPPFDHVPCIEMEDTTAGELELEPLVVYRFGARIKARRSSSVEIPSLFEIAYQAAAPRRAA